jgi:solute carrier family 35 (GDP-fucose transporter), member C1
VVDGSALLLSWYTNLLSAAALAPIIVLAGEGGGVLDLLSGGLVNTRVDGGMSPAATFVWGSLITVSILRNDCLVRLHLYTFAYRVPLAS